MIVNTEKHNAEQEITARQILVLVLVSGNGTEDSMHKQMNNIIKSENNEYVITSLFETLKSVNLSCTKFKHIKKKSIFLSD